MFTIFDFGYLADVVTELHESFDPERDVLQAIACEEYDYDANPDLGEGVAYVGQLEDFECVALHYAWALTHGKVGFPGVVDWDSFVLAASENHAFDVGRHALVYWTSTGMYGVQLCDETRFGELVAMHRAEYARQDIWDDALTIVYGTAFEVGAPIDGNVRNYANDGHFYVGYDSTDIAHVCDTDCLKQALPAEYVPAGAYGSFVSIHPYKAGDNSTHVRTADVSDFDPGDDYYVLCDACERVLVDERSHVDI